MFDLFRRKRIRDLEQQLAYTPEQKQIEAYHAQREHKPIGPT